MKCKNKAEKKILNLCILYLSSHCFPPRTSECSLGFFKKKFYLLNSCLYRRNNGKLCLQCIATTLMVRNVNETDKDRERKGDK